MASEMQWDEPRPGLRTPRSWQAALDAVRRRPGEWARLATYRGETSAYKAAQKLRRSPTLVEGPTAWEVAARRLPDGGSALYVRYRPPIAGAAAEGGGVGGDALHRAHAALRALIACATPAEATAVLVGFVQEVGGRVVPVDAAGPTGAGAAGDVVPVDLALGADPPTVAVAGRGTVERAVLEDLLPGLAEDAQRLLALRRAAARGGLPAHGEAGIGEGGPGTAAAEAGGPDRT